MGLPRTRVLEAMEALIERKITMAIGQLTEHEVEQEIVNKGLNKFPHLTPQDIDDLIVAENYWKVPDDTMIVCALRLKNGYTVIGEAACVSPENFDEEIGRKISRDKARDKIWALAGYHLACLRS
jgi:hypothetical protein